ncbi:uncharacterized protein K489DRAFT_384214 [Dissoconium aciculare CBS 342.82]|jgi:hypothetical protein|uniref:Uncharacterized protein n=1 Tax=Dissoconium aciculare CBS 342.82 TaxID=1314786 RepID=A0A6J3LVH9_9PEZI|nr:uncharacterized protein K489DRAFT_384214 [Dissoconium aciculare CBS 342.82]KAF1819294.1 hypothetical protein K489DRAFT_384214 [Dissoconium aciculare CBS 342.82]
MMAKEWQFLNFTSIEDSTDHRTRTFIRSHVTKRQHQLAKRKVVQPPNHNLPQGQNTFAVQFKVEPEEEPDAGWASRATTELLVPASSNSRNQTRRLAGKGKKLKPGNRPAAKNVAPEKRLARMSTAQCDSMDDLSFGPLIMCTRDIARSIKWASRTLQLLSRTISGRL